MAQQPHVSFLSMTTDLCVHLLHSCAEANCCSASCSQVYWNHDFTREVFETGPLVPTVYIVLICLDCCYCYQLLLQANDSSAFSIKRAGLYCALLDYELLTWESSKKSLLVQSSIELRGRDSCRPLARKQEERERQKREREQREEAWVFDVLCSSCCL